MSRGRRQDDEKKPAPQYPFCTLCGKTGMVEVLSNGRMGPERPRWYPGDKFQTRIHLVTAACTCPWGTRINEGRRNSAADGENPCLLPVYNGKSMRLYLDFMRDLMRAEQADSKLPPGQKHHVEAVSAVPERDYEADAGCDSVVTPINEPAATPAVPPVARKQAILIEPEEMKADREAAERKACEKERMNSESLSEARARMEAEELAEREAALSAP